MLSEAMSQECASAEVEGSSYKGSYIHKFVKPKQTGPMFLDEKKDYDLLNENTFFPGTTKVRLVRNVSTNRITCDGTASPLI
jgi:hypothetical protein